MKWVYTLLAAGLLQAVSAQWGRPPPTPPGERTCQTMGRECIPLKECRPLAGLAQHGKRPTREEVMKLQQAHCGFTGTQPKVCCDQSTPNKPSTGDRTKPRPNIMGVSSGTPQANLRLLPLDVCGPQTADRIINGVAAQVMELPWMVRLGYRRDEYSQEFDYNCGGSLINNRYVLTAAHCINENTGLIPVSVRLGELDTTTDIDCSSVSGEEVCAPPVVDVAIERIIKHKNYGENRFQNDIALLRLISPVEFTEAVMPVCLPVERTEQLKDLTGTRVTVAGWGRVANRNGAGGSKTLQKVHVPVSRTRDCAAAYVRLNLDINGEKQLCAGDQGKDSCQGDSGGPLTTAGEVRGTLRVIQHGVVSFGPSHCATEGTPGVYTKISHYVPWIVSNLEP